jgi:murein DD-endopeptidase MepM/ murein hydrolase activator NlpD
MSKPSISKLWREAAVAALVCGGLAACETTPHYPIDANDARGPAPLSIAKPQYPIDASQAAPGSGRDSVDASARPTAPSDAAPADPAAPASPPLAAPVGQVDSHPLPPPGPSADAGGAHLEYASTAGETAPGPQPATMPAASSGAAPVAGPQPAAPQPAAPSQDASLTPRQVIHDQPTTASPQPPSAPYVARQSATLPPTAGGGSGDLFINGPVVNASGNVFENYEVQGGDHVDALARNFSTTRDQLLDVNHIRAPYVIRPGQIIKVPVAKAYVARTGDTLTGVAQRFSVSPSELAQLNHLSERDVLTAGQQIGLPSSMRDRGPQRLMNTPYTQPRYAQAAPRPYYGSSSYGSSSYSSGSHGYVTQVPQQPTMVPDAGYHAMPAPSAPEAAPTLSDAQITAAARGRFAWPVRGDIVKKFGPLGIGQRNDGVDIKAAQGTDVRAAAPGEVVYAGNQVPGFGNLVLIKHSDGWVTAYAHLDNVSVQMRQQVSQGQTLGSVGMTGGLTEPELHFEVRYAPTAQDKARPIDPVLVLPAA